MITTTHAPNQAALQSSTEPVLGTYAKTEFEKDMLCQITTPKAYYARCRIVSDFGDRISVSFVGSRGQKTETVFKYDIVSAHNYKN